MEEDRDTTVLKSMRKKNVRAERRSFLPPLEFKRLRTDILMVSQQSLANHLINPVTGEPVVTATICRWERGVASVPLWAARRLRHLAEVAIRIDQGKEKV